MPAKVTGEDFQSLLTLLEITQGEITRYRDREWTNVGVFTTGLVAIIGFVLAYPTEASATWLLVDLALVSLVCGNVFYTSYVHSRLTGQRVLRRKIEDALGLTALKVDDKPILAPHITPTTFWNGFFSHLLPFFLCDAALALVGIYLATWPH